MPSDRLARVKSALSKSPPEQLRSPLWPRQQCTFLYYPELEASPFHDPAKFAWLRDVEAAFPTIQAELDALVAERSSFVHVSKERSDEVADGDWGSFGLVVYGRRAEENCARCPETMRVLDGVPDRAGLAMFMALAPHSHVRPHYGTNNVKLRVHLGLHSPKDAHIRIDTETRQWQDGKALVIDDSFQHEVWNNSDTTRFILLFDFFHPDLSADEKTFLKHVEAQVSDDAWQTYAPDETARTWKPAR